MSSVAPLRPRRLSPYVSALVLALGIGTVALFLRSDATPPREPAAAVGSGAPGAPAAAVATQTDAAHRADALAVPASPVPTFEEYVAQLTELALATSHAVQAKDHAAAKEADERARATFGALVAHHPDSAELGLAALQDAPAPPAGDPARARRAVLLLIVDHGLTVYARHHAAGGDRGPLNAFVAAILGALPADASLANDLGRTRLARKPHLGPAHEPAVEQLVALAADGAFPEDVAAELLLTLWQNLLATGAADAASLANRALLRLTAANGAERLAACRWLLRDERHRHLALDAVRAANDRALANRLALVAGEELPPDTALAVLKDLGTTGDNLTAGFLAIAARDGEAIRRAYERHLADDIDPQHRADLVTGAGFTRGPEGIALAQLALDHDRNPAVRVRSLFVLTAQAADAVGESTLHRLLDDPEFAKDPANLAAVVLALRNLERAGLANAIDRLGQRLRALPLFRGDRAELEKILARALPGGGAR